MHGYARVTAGGRFDDFIVEIFGCGRSFSVPGTTTHQSLNCLAAKNVSKPKTKGPNSAKENLWVIANLNGLLGKKDVLTRVGKRAKAK